MTRHSFEENYFADYYKPNVGNFSDKDLKRSINWFTGWFKHLQRFVDFKKGKGRKVLEIGCSIGGASAILADRGFNVFATDISEYAVSHAKQLANRFNRKIKFSLIDVQKKIMIKEKFDIIICFEVIEHLEYPLKAVKNMQDRLKKDGMLICSTPNGENDVYYDPTHINVKPAEEWKRIFKKIGFKKVILSQVTFLPFFYKFNPHFHVVFPFKIYSRKINSPLFIIAKN